MKNFKSFFKKNWSTIVLVVFIGLMLIPSVRMPVQVFVQRLISFSPKAIPEKEQQTIENFNWQLVDEQNNLISFSDLKGEVIIINFWATWCPPCVAEMPDFDALYRSFNSKVKFLFVSNESFEKQLRFKSKNDYKMQLYQPVTNPPEELESNSLPTSFLIDRKGNIVIKKVGSADWNSDKVRILITSLL